VTSPPKTPKGREPAGFCESDDSDDFRCHRRGTPESPKCDFAADIFGDDVDIVGGEVGDVGGGESDEGDGLRYVPKKLEDVFSDDDDGGDKVEPGAGEGEGKAPDQGSSGTTRKRMKKKKKKKAPEPAEPEVTETSSPRKKHRSPKKKRKLAEKKKGDAQVAETQLDEPPDESLSAFPDAQIPSEDDGDDADDDAGGNKKQGAPAPAPPKKGKRGKKSPKKVQRQQPLKRPAAAGKAQDSPGSISDEAPLTALAEKAPRLTKSVRFFT
jgi:hypothetical protein